MDENFCDISSANLKHDREHGNPSLLVPIRSGFNPGALIRRGKLTDKQIRKYELAGYYSADFKAARKELWQKKAAKRQGNFDVMRDGRMIYRP